MACELKIKNQTWLQHFHIIILDMNIVQVTVDNFFCQVASVSSDTITWVWVPIHNIFKQLPVFSSNFNWHFQISQTVLL